LAGVHRAADYLARACREDGRFVYRVDLRDGRELGGYNMLRHAGAMYALANYQERWPEPTVEAALARAADYLKREHVRAVPGNDWLAVWSEPRDTAPREAKLGGAGLALTALGELEQVAPGSTPKVELRRLADFIVFMQKPDGTFHSKFLVDRGRDDSWVSLYYPGEAALGLLVLDELEGQTGGFRPVVVKALMALAAERRGQTGVPPDHWALLATARLPLAKLDRETQRALLDHGIQIAESMLSDRAPHAASSPLRGCFGDDGRTTPTATRLEGLLALESALSKSRARSAQEDALRARIRRVADEGVAFLLRAQVRSGRYRGALPRAFGRHEARIDYTQHALSAFMQYAALNPR
jgi:hypothetical protein